MNITFVLVAVIIVLVTLAGFILTIVSFLANSASNKIRKDMNNVISSYNSIIDIKTREIEKLQAKQMELEEAENLLENKDKIDIETKEVNESVSSVPISNFISSSANYRNNSLSEGYNKIKNNFSYVQKDIDNSINMANAFKRKEIDVMSLKVLIDYLDYNQLYDMLALSADEQYNALDKGLKRNYHAFFEKYISETNNVRNFDVIKFYDWLKRLLKENSDKPQVRSSNINSEEEFDPSICDGFQVYIGNKLYDYSVSKRDLS